MAAVRNLQYDSARELIEDGLRYADAVEQSYCARVMGAAAAIADWAAGNWDEAVVRGEHALAEGGSERARIMALWPLGYAALGRGGFDAARGYLQKAADFADASEIVDFGYAAAWGLAELDVLSGRPDEAIKRTDLVLALAQDKLTSGLFAPIIVTGARARLAARRPSEVEAWLAASEQVVGDAEWAAAALHHAHGVAQLATGSISAARKSLERAVELWAARPRVWEALWAGSTWPRRCCARTDSRMPWPPPRTFARPRRRSAAGHCSNVPGPWAGTLRDTVPRPKRGIRSRRASSRLRG